MKILQRFALFVALMIPAAALAGEPVKNCCPSGDCCPACPFCNR